MKRIGIGLLSLALLAVLAVPARADILWEPYDNAFFDRHRDAMTVVIRDFLANGEEGSVTLREAPRGGKVVARYENGTKLCVYNVYRDYGLIRVWEETEDGWQETYGWTPLSDLILIYDHLSFQEEYGGEIRDYRDEFSDGGEVSLVNFYEYPGAPEVKDSYRPQEYEIIRDALTGTRTERSCISQVFTDEEGKTWGYVGYMYGRVEGWFCLDDPGGTDFPIRSVPEVTYTPPQTPISGVGSLPYLLVGGVVAVTAGLLYWFYGRKRGESPGSSAPQAR